MRDMDNFWVQLKRNVTKGGGITYTEIDGLSVFEFFIMVSQLDKEIAEAEEQERIRQARQRQK